ncbi:UDP-glucuronosyl/UDP-glucosyltransferase [Macleaya cordata]|uniref:Glycosyltransferase n=1 Tax=Macleaya cordata TaxID=56857 RepID=A0A200R8L2_MACCD|nr:UDP-glucuronosyl/UDP-glucosyltransferase [Macleaya cordata]
MDSEAYHQLHVFFFPLMAYGHMIPTVDIARLFAARGVKATIITTPLNASTLSKTIDRDRLSGLDIDIQIIRFPAVEAGLPEGVENLDDIPSPEMIAKFSMAVDMLQQPLEQLLEEHRPDFIVADLFLPWSTNAAGKFGIPRIVFHGTSFFSQCVSESLRSCTPNLEIKSDKGTFLVPGLPDKIEMTMSQLPDHSKVTPEFAELLDRIRDSVLRSYGDLINSFYELESNYADHYRKVMERRAWHIGPVSLRNRNTIDKAQRGKKSSIDDHYVLSWLDSKKPNSVLYICFGSVCRFSNDQLFEIAMGLEDSGFSFVWVVKALKKDEKQRILPQGFEERMEGKGLIIRDWGPQVLILDHPAVGGFMTHCGWNSILEGVSAGVPMITWPVFGEQFYNEKFVTQVLKNGIQVGVEDWNFWIDAKNVSVNKEQIEQVVTQLMGEAEDAEEMRRRAKQLSEMAKSAVEVGGSSYADLTALIEELKMHRKPSS